MWALWPARRMSHLAARFSGKTELHVVDPLVDLNYMIQNPEKLRNNVDIRGIEVDVAAVSEQYNKWWNCYQTVKGTEKKTREHAAAKRELKEHSQGILQMLFLPNPQCEVDSVHAPKSSPTPSTHAAYLARKGMMRIDKAGETCHLVGWPVEVLRVMREELQAAHAHVQLASPPHMARAAVMEAINVPLSDYASFTDGSSDFPDTYLVGHSLPALLTFLIRSKFSHSTNEWPIRMQTSGMAYYAKQGSADLMNGRQRAKWTHLGMSRTAEESVSLERIHLEEMADVLRGVSGEGGWRRAAGRELHNAESCAWLWEVGGVCVARVSRLDCYLSRRLNIQSEKEGFCHLLYTEVDLYRLLAKFVDVVSAGKDVPEKLKALVE